MDKRTLTTLLFLLRRQADLDRKQHGEKLIEAQRGVAMSLVPSEMEELADELEAGRVRLVVPQEHIRV